MKSKQEMKKILGMTKEQLKLEYNKSQSDYFKAIFEVSSKKKKDISQIKKIRRYKARILTSITQRQGV